MVKGVKESFEMVLISFKDFAQFISDEITG